MHSKELVEAALRREEVDRVPFCPPFQGYWALELAGVSVMDSIRRPELAADAQLRVVGPCHMDGVEAMWDWLLPAEAMGCLVKIPEHGTIPTMSHIIDGPGDLDGLQIPEIGDFYRLTGARDTVGILADRIGRDHHLMSSILSPFTLAGELRGVEQMMMECMTEEDFVQDLLNLSCEVDRRFVEEIVKWDTDSVILCDPTASGDLISGDDYAKYSKRSTAEMSKIIRSAGKTHISHICGDTSDRMDHVADTGCAAFSVDHQVDIGEAVGRMGGRIAIIGNMNPSAILFCGTPDIVRGSTLELLKRGGKKGYMLGSGCDIPVGTAYENVKAMSEVFMDY